MGIYIKGLTIEDWYNLTSEEIDEGAEAGCFNVIEVKPHGRLIDVDALCKKFEKIQEKLMLEDIKKAEVTSLIWHQPIIIEAEGES